MKKKLLLIVMVILAMGMVFAATSTKFTKYANIFKSGEYTFKCTVYPTNPNGTKTGDSYPMTVAKHAGEYYMSTSAQGMTMKVVIKNDGSVYMINDTDKTVMVVPQGGDTEVFELPTTFIYSKNGNGKLDGKSLYYEVQSDEDDIVYWYNGNNLYAIQKEDDDDGAIMMIESIVQKADASLFEIPSGYEIYDMSSMFSASYETTAVDADDYDWEKALSDIDWNEVMDSAEWTTTEDHDDDEHYYAFGVLMGLSDAKAQAFEEMMRALDDIEWENMNRYYDYSNDRYDMKASDLGSVNYISSWTVENIQKMMRLFK